MKKNPGSEKPVWNYDPKTAGKTTMILGSEKTDYRKKDEVNKERTPTTLTHSRKKLWKRKRLLFRLKRRPKKKKLPIKLRQEKAKKMPKKAKRNDISPQAHSSISLHLSKAERLPKDSTFSINLKQYYKLSMNSPTKIEKYDHMAKVIIIGDSGIGKTVLITRYC